MREDIRRRLEEDFDEFLRENYNEVEPDLSFDEISGKIGNIKRSRGFYHYLRIAAAVFIVAFFSVYFFTFYKRRTYIKKIDESYVKVMSNINYSVNPFDGKDLLKGLDNRNPFSVKNYSFREIGK